MENILNVLQDIELNEQQVAALDTFFNNFKKKVAREVIQKYEEQLEEKYIPKEKAEEAFKLFEEDCKRAFELFEEDAEKAFNLGMEDLQRQYTENMTTALSELYDDIAERVRKDFLESREYQLVKKIKELIIPVLEDTDSDLVAKIKQLSEEKEKIEEENRELAKSQAIATLLRDIPSEYVKIVEEFISKGRDENDVIDRFNTIVEMLETKLSLEKKEEKEKKLDKEDKEKSLPLGGELKFARKKQKLNALKEEKEIVREKAEPTFRPIYDEFTVSNVEDTVDDTFNKIINKVFRM